MSSPRSLRAAINAKCKSCIYDPGTRGSWRDQTIYPNQPASYTMAGNAGKFRISTQGRGFVEYAVRAGWRYNIVWDNNKGTWDLRTLQRGA